MIAQYLKAPFEQKTSVPFVRKKYKPNEKGTLSEQKRKPDPQQVIGVKLHPQEQCPFKIDLQGSTNRQHPEKCMLQAI